MPDPQKFTGYVVSHTHWDREWYLTFQEFRVRLVRLMDNLLQVCRSVPEFESFQLDGQTLPLEDYLAIRPNNEDELKSFVKAGKIVVGPWYVLADEFLASGEATIRNLLLGHKIAQMYGDVMKVGYVPDTFGHIWQLPQVLQGFSIPYSYLFRGYPPLFGGFEENKSKNADFPLEHYWAAPDGSKVLNIHHITGYGNASQLCEGDPKQAEIFPDMKYMSGFSKILMAAARLIPRTTTPHLLFMNGGDHQEAEGDLPQFITAWNENEEIAEEENLEIDLRHAKLIEYFQALEKSGVNFPMISGEMRGSAYTQVTPACLSTRMYLKQQNFQVSRALERYAEPLSTLAYYYLGTPYPGNFLWEAWKWYLKNQPHDSICGCSLDRVHDDMETRSNWALDIAYQMANRGLTALTERIVLPEFPIGNHDTVFTIWNLTSNPAKRVVSGMIGQKGTGPFRVVDDQGQFVPGANIKQIADYRDLPKGQYLYKKFMRDWRVLFVSLPTSLPSYGFKIFKVESLQGQSGGILEDQMKKVGDLPPVEVKGWIVENGRIRVTIQENGSFSLEDIETGANFEACHLFENMADDGDEYDYSPLPDEIPLTTKELTAKREFIIQSDLMAVVRIMIDFPVPVALEGDWRKGEARTREQRTIPLHLESTVTVTAGSKLVEVSTKVHNVARDHRLRVLFPTGLQTGKSHADEHFMVQVRDITLPDDKGWYQPAQGLYHQDAFVDLSDVEKNYGLAVLNKGLPEFEILPNQNTITLTLFRAVGWLSKQRHLARPTGLNGPALPTPGGQCLRDFHFEYALFPHAGNWTNGELNHEAKSYITPPLFHEVDIAEVKEGVFWSGNSFFILSNPLIRVSALKKSECEPGVIIRLYNPSSDTQQTTLKFQRAIEKLIPVNMNEELEKGVPELLPDDEGIVRVTLAPYKIQTFFIAK